MINFILGLLTGLFIWFFFAIFIVWAIDKLMGWEFDGKIDAIKDKWVKKFLARKAILTHNQSESAERHIPEIPAEKEKTDPGNDFDKKKEKLSEMEARLKGMMEQNNPNLDLFDQVSKIQKEYAEEYYKVHKRLPPGYEG